MKKTANNQEVGVNNTNKHNKSETIRFISSEEIDGLVALEPEELFKKIMLWLKNFACTPENKIFRDRLGFAIFGEPYYAVFLLDVSHREKVIEAYKVFNPNPVKRLSAYIDRVEIANTYEKRNPPVGKAA